MVVQLHGPLAVFELRAWAAGPPNDPRCVAWTLDRFDAEQLLRRLCAEQSPRTLRALVADVQLGAPLAHDTHDLIAAAARLITRGHIRVFRTPPVIMTSDEPQLSIYEPPEPVENEFEQAPMLQPLLDEGPLHMIEPTHQVRPPPVLLAAAQTLPPPTLIPLVEVLDAPIPVCVVLEAG